MSENKIEMLKSLIVEYLHVSNEDIEGSGPDESLDPSGLTFSTDSISHKFKILKSPPEYPNCEICFVTESGESPNGRNAFIHFLDKDLKIILIQY